MHYLHAGSQDCALAVPVQYTGMLSNKMNLRKEEKCRLFCFLPLPSSGMEPFHLHARFHVSQDRRGILLDERLGPDSDQIQANKNVIEEKLTDMALDVMQHLLAKIPASE